MFSTRNPLKTILEFQTQTKPHQPSGPRAKVLRLSGDPVNESNNWKVVEPRLHDDFFVLLIKFSTLHTLCGLNFSWR
jgi:hypothetical protein